MPARPANLLLRHLRRLGPWPDAGSDTDAELLERFVHRHDDAAFAALVRRHGPMALGVCRRVLQDAHAAEDALQAVLLVLARRAGSIRPADRLAAWLFGVARRVALRARRAAARRHRHEARARGAVPPPSSPDPLDELTARELLAALDEEVQRLPEVNRLPVILCCLEGRSQEEAASQLGWTPGSVKGRLERGRVLLHRRLAQRGLSLPAALAALEVARGGAVARLPAAAMAPPRAPRVAALARCKVGAVLMFLAAAAAAAGLFVYRAPVGDRPAAQQRPVPLRGPAEDGAILWTSDVVGDVAFAPNGRTLATAGRERQVSLWDRATGRRLRRLTRQPAGWIGRLIFSPDGKSLAALCGWNGNNRTAVYLWEEATGRLLRRLEGKHTGSAGLTFALGGKALAVNGGDVVQLWDAATGKLLRSFPLPGEPVAGCDFSPDGSVLAVSYSVRRGGGPPAPDRGVEDGIVRLWDVARGKVLRVLRRPRERVQEVALAPGGRVLATQALSRGGAGWVVTFWDVRSGQELGSLPPGDQLSCLAFSADGRSLAAVQQQAIRIWEVVSGKERRRLGAHPASLSALAFAPDGKTLASVCLDGQVRIFDLVSGRELHGPSLLDSGGLPTPRTDSKAGR